MTNEEIAEEYSRKAEFKRTDIIVMGNIEIPHWEHNMKELILDAITEATKAKDAEIERLIRSNLPSKIDYTYCHNAKCEMIKYIEERVGKITEQMEYEIGMIIQRVAHNEADRRQIIS